ncbi:MAG: hypothetical protein FJZ92_09925 [Chloroflexi bacterium]|nr:hypothetical protein [Chloroflexota bacterium]
MTDFERFGRLTRIAATSAEGWRNETSDFTPWLAENLDRLGEAVGLSLELREREHRVGRYYLDLLADSRGRTVIIESQFGKTDHDHLGKLLTYCAGTAADVVVWIAESLTEEHRAALEWLNESTRAEVLFYGVELELLKIGDPAPAPHFKVVVAPNEIVKERPPASAGMEEWDWERFAELRIPPSRIVVGRELTRRLNEELAARGIALDERFRKGYVAYQRPGGYNVIVVDLAWRRVRLAVKLPQPPAALGLTNPYPGLEESWTADEREWGWTITQVDQVPDVAYIVDLAERFWLAPGARTQSPAARVPPVPDA